MSPHPASAIYVASKAKYGPMWRSWRDAGIPISSTWIDSYEPGKIQDWDLFWSSCVSEVKVADAVVLFVPELTEIVKGAFVEVGVAIACGIPVFSVSDFNNQMSFTSHHLVSRCLTLSEAFLRLGHGA